MGVFTEFLDECAGFLSVELNTERGSGEAPQFISRVNQFLNALNTSLLLQDTPDFTISQLVWHVPPFLRKKEISGFVLYFPLRNRQTTHQELRVFLDRRYINDFKTARTLILFGTIRQILVERTKLTEETCSLITFIIFLYATKNIRKISVLTPFLPKTINLSPTFKPTIRNSFLELIKHVKLEEYCSRFFRKLDQIAMTQKQVVNVIFSSFNFDFSLLNQKEIQFFHQIIGEGVKPLREYQTELSLPTRSRYLSRLMGTHLLRIRSFFNLENLGLASYHLFVGDEAVRTSGIDLTDFSFLRSLRKIGNWKVVNFFYRKESHTLSNWYSSLRSELGNQIQLFQQISMEAYFNPKLYNAETKQWEAHWKHQPNQVVELPKPLSNVTEMHLRVALEMMRGPYKRSTLADKFRHNRNKVYSVISDLEETRTVYLKYMMTPHQSLIPLTLIGKGGWSECQKYAKALPFAVLHSLEDFETKRKHTLAFFRVPPKYIPTIGKRLMEIKGTYHFALDLEPAETSPKYTPYFSKGTWKLKPLPQPKNTPGK
ncbi:MAG: hypothetical protein D6732_02810 [Methanobacteriota archaeon]|nr:MAG: hypothetical protein D6732_02810 [Euryarchaeota archaeon]